MITQPLRVRRRGRWVEVAPPKSAENQGNIKQEKESRAERRHEHVRMVIVGCAIALLLLSALVTEFAASRSSELTVQEQLMDAISRNDLPAAQRALDDGAVVDPTESALPPLALAAALNRREIVELLVQRGADIEMRAEGGPSALIHASRANSEGLVEYLLRRGADVSAEDVYHMTALHGAARSGSLRTVSLLLSHGALVNARGVDGRTPLMVATRNSAAVVDLLLESGAEINATDGMGRTPLMWAAMAGRIESIERLLAAGARRDAKTTNGKTAADLALTYGHEDAAEILNVDVELSGAEPR